MAKDCDILIPEDFVLKVVSNHKLRDKYQEFSFGDFVEVSPSLLQSIMANEKGHKNTTLTIATELSGIARQIRVSQKFVA